MEQSFFTDPSLDQRYLSVWLYFCIPFSYMSPVCEWFALCFKNNSKILFF